MATYETDDEKVEAIKKWWKENGVSVVGGIVLGLAVIFGWRAWTDYRTGVATRASAAFEQILASAGQGEMEAAAKQAERLSNEYGSTAYAALAELVAARALYEKGDPAAAQAALEGVVERAPDPAIARLAGLRLARIQVSQGELDAAAATVAAHDTSPAFAGDFATVRGDIAAARGDTAGARAAYEQALGAGTGLAELVRLKLDNLPADRPGAAGAEPPPEAPEAAPEAGPDAAPAPTAEAPEPPGTDPAAAEPSAAPPAPAG